MEKEITTKEALTKCIPHPAFFRVLVKVEKVDEKSGGYIYVPDVVLERQQMGHTIGEVIEIGPTAFLEYIGTPPQKGDIVMFAKYSGQCLAHRNTEGHQVENEEYRYINDEDVIGIIFKGEVD